MTFSATIPINKMDGANAELESLGHGHGNFSVLLHQGSSPANHVGMHAWDDSDLLAPVQSLSVPGLVIRHVPGTTVNFGPHINSQYLQRLEESGAV